MVDSDKLNIDSIIARLLEGISYSFNFYFYLIVKNESFFSLKKFLIICFLIYFSSNIKSFNQLFQ